MELFVVCKNYRHRIAEPSSARCVSARSSRSVTSCSVARRCDAEAWRPGAAHWRHGRRCVSRRSGGIRIPAGLEHMLVRVHYIKKVTVSMRYELITVVDVR